VWLLITLLFLCHISLQTVTPEVPLSDETQKLSFGKFLEISFYCRESFCYGSKCWLYSMGLMIVCGHVAVSHLVK